MSGNGENRRGVVDSSVLPEGCIANVLSLTSPRDVGRLSLVAPIFRSAAESDAVWKRFLPRDYEDIIARSVDRFALTFASKKELYLHLCDHPLIIEGGTKSFSLQKWSGKRCYMLAARDLSIVWGNTPRYWRWTSLPESRFSEVAELILVSWLEIRGKINTSMLSPNTTYAAYLVFKSTARAYGLEYQPAEVSVGINGGGGETQTVYLDPDGQYCKLRGDGWMEIELGQYVNKGGQDGEMEMSLMEVKQHWKSGLIIQGLEIRPKERVSDQNITESQISLNAENFLCPGFKWPSLLPSSIA